MPNQLDFETWGRAFVRNLKDFAQIFTGFGIGIAVLSNQHMTLDLAELTKGPASGLMLGAVGLLAFAGITSATSLSENGFGPVMFTGAAALAVGLLLAAAAAPEVTDAASMRRVLSRDDGPVVLLTVAALTPVLDAVLVAGMTMPLPATEPATPESIVRWRLKLLREHQIEVPIIAIDGRAWVRISAQVYNELSDYEALARVFA